MRFIVVVKGFEGMKVVLFGGLESGIGFRIFMWFGCGRFFFGVLIGGNKLK